MVSTGRKSPAELLTFIYTRSPAGTPHNAVQRGIPRHLAPDVEHLPLHRRLCLASRGFIILFSTDVDPPRRRHLRTLPSPRKKGFVRRGLVGLFFPGVKSATKLRSNRSRND